MVSLLFFFCLAISVWARSVWAMSCVIYSLLFCYLLFCYLLFCSSLWAMSLWAIHSHYVSFWTFLYFIHNKIKVIARLLNEIDPDSEDSDDEGVEETKESDTVDETPKKKRGRPSKRKPLVSGDGDEVAQTESATDERNGQFDI